MSRELYACLYAREFPFRRCCACVRIAWQTGRGARRRGRRWKRFAQSIALPCSAALSGMTRVEAERINGLLLLPRSLEM